MVIIFLTAVFWRRLFCCLLRLRSWLLQK